MKKMKRLFRITLIMLLLSFFHVVITNPTQMSTTASGNREMRYSQLVNENYQLKKNLTELKNKMKKIEDKINDVTEYNNRIYSQILDVDFDTTNFNEYKNDSAYLVFNEYDSIFDNLDDRTIYASELLALQLKKVQDISELFNKNKNAINYYPNISPIKTGDFIRISSPYGWREHPILKKYLFHEGIDISANIGTDVHSTAQGTVEKVMYSKYGYGNRVVITHAYGFKTTYAHLNNINVKKGEWVKKNQKIGTVGNTGRSTNPHLHYEIQKYDELRDPLGYFYTNITNELLANKK